MHRIGTPRPSVGSTHVRWGQALVEMTMVLGLLMVLMLGTVCVCQVLFAGYAVGNAARAAAHQAAIQGGAPAAAFSAAEMVLQSGVGTSYDRATVTVTCARTPCRRYDPITVRIVYRDSYWTPVLMFSEFTVTAEATRASERDQQ